VRLLFAGTPEVALPPLRALLESRHQVVAVLTRPDAPVGRSRTPVPSPVASFAAEAGIEVLRPARPSDPELLRRLEELAPDCAPVVAYGGLVPPAALGVPVHGWVNLHFSVLPAWRGAAPVQHAVMAGDDVTGACTFRLEEGLDTGPVFGVVTTAIGPRDTAGDLLARLAADGAGLLTATLDGIESGRLVPVPQVGEASYAPKIGVDDARVVWSHPAMRVDRLVRGCTPAPGAWTTLQGDRLGLGPVVPEPAVEGLAPGALQVGKREVLVGTGSSAVRLGLVRPQGRREMAAADWARGARLVDGEVLA
jgi:methionyl-tRNA formyltransferase